MTTSLYSTFPAVSIIIYYPSRPTKIVPNIGYQQLLAINIQPTNFETHTSALRIMQQTTFLTLPLLTSAFLTIGWITYATSLPDDLLSAFFAENGNQLRGVSTLSGYLTTSYYEDKNCKTLKYAVGAKLGACEYLSGDDKHRMTTVDQNAISVIYYHDKDCSTVYNKYPSVAYTDGACTTSISYHVSATRDMSAQGYTQRSVNTT
jgi:hypothetical protein